MNPDLLTAESHFAFGKNWLDYAAKIDEASIVQAVADLQRLSGRERFDGMSFLDIGCGSGLHALAATRMGASRVLGVDIDADSIAASRATFTRFAPGADAHFDVTSVFDMTPQTHGGFDIVYSWGVLHHTGDMRLALTVAASLVRPEGEIMVALYRRTPWCGLWLRIKRWYSMATPSSQKMARWVYIKFQQLLLLLTRQSWRERVANYHLKRGMNYYNDIHDWMGGYPYESITPDDCRSFFGGLGFEVAREFLIRVSRRRWLVGLLGSGCDEYVFVRKCAR